MSISLARFARPALPGGARLARAGAVALVALLVAACGGGGFSEAPTPRLFGQAVVFGASLTDTGNRCPTPAAAPDCPPVPPYASGRYSNGTLFIETIAARYGAGVTRSTAGGTNYAYAGARTGTVTGAAATTIPSMLAQLQQFIDLPSSGALLNPQTLFVIDASTFGNNFNAAAAAGLLPAGGSQLVSAAVTDIVTIMSRLYSGGARNMLVINVPNLGNTPLVRAQGEAARTGATQLTVGFNQGLAGAIQANLLPTAPGLKVYTLDLFTIGNSITTTPSIAGLSNAIAACTAVPACVASAATADTYLYWDSFHPTRAAGAYIASQAALLLPAP